MLPLASFVLGRRLFCLEPSNGAALLPTQLSRRAPCRMLLLFNDWCRRLTLLAARPPSPSTAVHHHRCPLPRPLIFSPQVPGYICLPEIEKVMPNDARPSPSSLVACPLVSLPRQYFRPCVRLSATCPPAASPPTSSRPFSMSRASAIPSSLASLCLPLRPKLKESPDVGGVATPVDRWSGHVETGVGLPAASWCLCTTHGPENPSYGETVTANARRFAVNQRFR